jgi:hypothetical protein
MGAWKLRFSTWPPKSESLVSDWKPMEDVDVWAALLPHSLLCDDVRRREVAGCVTSVVQSTNFLLLSTGTLAVVIPAGKS